MKAEKYTCQTQYRGGSCWFHFNFSGKSIIFADYLKKLKEIQDFSAIND